MTDSPNVSPTTTALRDALDQAEREALDDPSLEVGDRIALLAAIDAMRSKRPTCRLQGAKMFAELCARLDWDPPVFQ